MATVYLARDPGASREVALKVLELSGAASLTRFQREGELAGRLDHPNVVRVHSFGVEGRRHFLVCELIEGARSLQDAWPDADLRQRVTWLRDVALGVGHAHAQGVVHRDLKPDNVLIDPSGRAKVADFGVAGAADLERLTRTGAILGTPLYMSPEQFAGSGIHPQTDVWALGVLLYEALYDELPFNPESIHELVSAVIGSEARPPAGRSVPRDLVRLWLGALEKSPEARPANGDEFARHLNEWLEGRASTYRRSPPSRAKRLLLACVGLVALGVVGLGLHAASELARPSSAPSPSRATVRASPEAQSASDVGSKVAELVRSLRTSEEGPARLSALRASRAWLEANPDDPAGRALREAQSRAAERPVGLVSLDLPAAVPPAQARSLHAWGDDVLVRVGPLLAVIDGRSLERKTAWSDLALEEGPLRALERDSESAWIREASYRPGLRLLQRVGGGLRVAATTLHWPSDVATAFDVHVGSQLAIAFSGRRVRIGRVGQRPAPPAHMKSRALSVRLSPSGARAALLFGRTGLEVWDLGSPSARAEADEAPKALRRVQPRSPELELQWVGENDLLFGDYLGVSHLDVATGVERRTPVITPLRSEAGGRVLALQGLGTPGSRMLVVSGDDVATYDWETLSQRAPRPWSFAPAHARAALLQGDTHWVLSSKDELWVFSAERVPLE